MSDQNPSVDEHVQEMLADELIQGSMPRMKDRISASDFDDTRVSGCTCGHIVCGCRTKRNHVEGCKFRRAVACQVGIECEHGYDVCPFCDPCTCPPK